MNPRWSGSTPDVAAAVKRQSVAMTTANHCAARCKTAPVRKGGQIINLRTQTGTGTAGQMRLRWTAAVGECVSAGGVCVIGPNSGQCMGNTVRSMTSPALTMGGFCVEVRVSASKRVFAEMLSLTRPRPPFVCSSQVKGRVCRASARAQMAGQVRAAVVPSPRQPVSQPTACFVAGVADACVESAPVTTRSTPGISARTARPAKAPVSHTGTASLQNRKA